MATSRMRDLVDLKERQVLGIIFGCGVYLAAAELFGI